jgi:hypothetical protein
MRLMAFVSTTTHATVSGTLHRPVTSGAPNGLLSSGTPKPNSVSVSAAHACTASFTHGPAPRMSSTTPSARIGSEAHVSPSSGRGSSSRAGPGSTRAAQATPSTAAAMASPPKRGVGSECTRRGPGWSSAPTRSARARANGVSRRANRPAASANCSE